MKTLFAIAFAALTLTASPALAQESEDDGFVSLWEDTHNSVYGFRVEDFATTERVRAPFWVKVDHSRDATVTARKSMLRMVIDCKNDTVQVTSATSWDAAGFVMPRASYATDYSAKPVIPETVFESMHTFACSIMEDEG